MLELRGFFLAAELHPAQPLEIGEVDHKGVEAATGGLIWDAGQVSLRQTINIVGVYGPLLTAGLLFLMSGGPIQSGGLDEGRLVVVEDVCLGSAHTRGLSWVSLGAVAREELPDEPAAAEGAEETAPGRPQWHDHALLPHCMTSSWTILLPEFLVPLPMFLAGYLSVLRCGVEAGMSQVLLE